MNSCNCKCHDKDKIPYLENAIRIALGGPKRVILWIAPTMSGAKRALQAVKKFSKEGKVNLTHSEVKFENGSKIYFANEHNPDKFRGLLLDAVFIEEGVKKQTTNMAHLQLRR